MNFTKLGLNPPLLQAVNLLGYEIPTPIQAQSIPVLLKGQDLVAQAQTGTGKTAAFALSILQQIDVKLSQPQALVLAPTRELAIQVAEAFQSYAKFLRDFHVLPIYGGQDFRPQLRALQRGVHVVIGTPGRIMDHLRRGTLSLNKIKTVVLDEGDEMLKMGFIDDIEWILQQIPQRHQTALFSATMPERIRRVAEKYLQEPQRIKIHTDKATKPAIKQFYVQAPREHKLEALTRILEVEDFEAAIIFTRTKIASTELAEKLESRGYRVAAINGDMKQSLREQVIKRIKQSELDIVVATEVAARGLDVERISYVINYDVPTDVESYIHRIGRTGRAGREGRALVFVSPRERYMLKTIERVTGQAIDEMLPPSFNQVQTSRLKVLSDKIQRQLSNQDLTEYRRFISDFVRDQDFSAVDVAAALMSIQQPMTNNTQKDISFRSSREEEPRRDFKKKKHYGNKKPFRNKRR